MNNRDRGRRYELKAKHELEDADYLVEINQGKVMWIPDKKRPGRRIPITKRVDFFGAFDLVASNADHIRLIQIAAEGDTDGGDMAEKRRKIEALHGRFPGNVSLELWRWQMRRASTSSTRVPNGWTKTGLRRGEWCQVEED